MTESTQARHVGLRLIKPLGLTDPAQIVRWIAARIMEYGESPYRAATIRIEMPCGRIYLFQAATMPQSDTPCRCGRPEHVAVEWREVAE